MNSFRQVATVGLLLVMAAAGYGWLRTAPPATGIGAEPPVAGVESTATLVDRGPLDEANALLARASTPAARQYAERAVSVADHLLDLTFAAALRNATEHPAPPTPAAREAQSKLDAVAQRLVTDNNEILRLAAAVASAKAEQAGVLEGQRALAQVQFEIDQDEFAQAGKDLIAAGGDLRGRIQALVAEHEAAVPKSAPAPVAAPPGTGLFALLTHWLSQRRTLAAVESAGAASLRRVSELSAQRDALRARLTPADRTANAAATSAAGAQTAATLLASAATIASDHRQIASLDERLSALRDLTKVYDEWSALGRSEAHATLHRILLAGIVVLAVCVLLLFIDGWLGLGFDRLPLDRRQVQTLRTVTSVALQIAAVLFIALVILGPPTQLSTFLGLAGAGLTVALKDFIVAFIGWLVLMGKNGIRLGDWVEIDGVCGEVVELGIFHTVLLETGNWTDSGHPTGRRVTFTNSFAIQGHYFNFSTTGQWLWDELELVVPAGQDLYAVVGGITRVVTEMTAADAKLAEDEWRRAMPARKTAALSAAPAVGVKPVAGGTQVALRYIARADTRYQTRASLYQSAVDLLANRPSSPVTTPVVPTPAPPTGT